jgi:hypothetical protein
MVIANLKPSKRCLVRYCTYGHRFIFAQDRDKFAQSTLKKCNRCSELRIIDIESTRDKTMKPDDNAPIHLRSPQPKSSQQQEEYLEVEVPDFTAKISSITVKGTPKLELELDEFTLGDPDGKGSTVGILTLVKQKGYLVTVSITSIPPTTNDESKH